MNFIIKIYDNDGNELSSHEQTAEPQYYSRINSYVFEFDKFWMRIGNEVYHRLFEKVDAERKEE